MVARIIFCVTIAAAVLAVVLLATVSPLPHRSGGRARPPNSRTFTVYIHPATSTPSVQQQQQQRGAVHGREAMSALVFHHRMTAGPESTSRTVGSASGFLLPAAGEAGAAPSVFDTVHLAFDAPGLSGSLCVEASDEKGRHGRGRGGEEELRVVGGTGAFAFAQGHAVVRGNRRPGLGATAAALRLELSVSPAES